MASKQVSNISNKPKTILVVDDDANFRHLLMEILSPFGYEIAQARSTKDALSMLSSIDVALAIVDYRLPDQDGMSLITQFRDLGHKAPVVFISADWCDAKTFTWLRNILRVSLVLQKPIEPKLFYQQIQSLIPVQHIRPEPAPPQASAQEDQTMHQLEYERLIQAASGVGPSAFTPTAQELADFSAQSAQYQHRAAPHSEEKTQPGADTDRRAQVMQLRDKLEVEARIKNAQAQLRIAIPPLWEELTIAVKGLQFDTASSEKREEAMTLAHKLRGTAGSLGLSRVSTCAGRIEDYLIMLDPTEPTEHELLWNEIFRALAEGESGLRVAEQVEEDAVEALRFNVGNVLIVSGNASIDEHIRQLNPYIAANFTHVDNARDGLTQAHSARFDAAMIDLGLCGRRDAFALAREMRLSPLNSSLSIAYMLPGHEIPEPAHLIFAGASATLPVPFDQTQFEQSLRQLSQSRQIQQPRVLTVDDDHVLTRFVKAILDKRGMKVESLNEPINILEVLEDLEPDLVLLDVIMPGLSGYDVCRLIRKQERWRHLPVVFLTSKSDAQGRAAAFQAGGTDLLSKPILGEELITRVEAQLERNRAQRQKVTVDDLTDVLKPEIFLKRCQEATSAAQENKEHLALCLMDIDYFEEFDRYGVFASLQVLSTVSKILRSRFAAEALRGRFGDHGFALAFTHDNKNAIATCLHYLAREVEQATFLSEQGQKYEVRITTAMSSYPDDGGTFTEVLDTAKSRLLVNRRQKTGVTFFS